MIIDIIKNNGLYTIFSNKYDFNTGLLDYSNELINKLAILILYSSATEPDEIKFNFNKKIDVSNINLYTVISKSINSKGDFYISI